MIIILVFIRKTINISLNILLQRYEYGKNVKVVKIDYNGKINPEYNNLEKSKGIYFHIPEFTYLILITNIIEQILSKNFIQYFIESKML